MNSIAARCPNSKCPTQKYKDHTNLLECISTLDTGSSGYENHDIAFTVYICHFCNSIIKEDVWDNAGITVLDYNNKVTSYPEEKLARK